MKCYLLKIRESGVFGRSTDGFRYEIIGEVLNLDGRKGGTCLGNVRVCLGSLLTFRIGFSEAYEVEISEDDQL